MNYKLWKNVDYKLTPTQQILYNRGIPLDKQDSWLNADWENVPTWFDLEDVNIEEAVWKTYQTIDNEKDILVICDCDVDGYSSAAILMNYFYDILPQYYKEHISYVLHSGKQHGLNDVLDYILDKKPGLVLCPDSGTNDLDEHKILAENSIECIVLDHHIQEWDIVDTEYATIVNNQNSYICSHSLSGAGIAYLFIECYDYLLYNSKHDIKKYIDLCFLGNCGDMMNYQDIAIRAITNCGIKNIHNAFIKQIASANDYSISKMNGLNYYSTAFYIVPFINATIRSGTQEEKEIVFRSLLNSENQKEIPSSKRGEKGLTTSLYKEAVTIVQRVKRRQTKEQDEAMEELDDIIHSDKLLDNSILLVLLDHDTNISPNIRGLVANKLQAKYQKPTAILTFNPETNEYAGSTRNYSLSPITNLKEKLEETGEIEWCIGHQAANGCCIKAENVNSFLKKFNELYKDVDQTPFYMVDYEWTAGNVIDDIVLNISELNIYGQEIPESKIVIKDISLNTSNCTLMGLQKGNPTIKITLPNCSTTIIKFKSSQEEYDELTTGDKCVTIIGKPSKNEWQGSVTPQILVEDWEIKEEWIF